MKLQNTSTLVYASSSGALVLDGCVTGNGHDVPTNRGLENMVVTWFKDGEALTVQKNRSDAIKCHGCYSNIDKDNDQKQGYHVTLTLYDVTPRANGLYSFTIHEREMGAGDASQQRVKGGEEEGVGWICKSQDVHVDVKDHCDTEVVYSERLATGGPMPGYKWSLVAKPRLAAASPLVEIDVFVYDWTDCNVRIIEGIWLKFADGDRAMYGGCVTTTKQPPSQRETLTLDKGERITCIRVGHGWVVDNITIDTTHRTWGPLGGPGGEEVTEVHVPSGNGYLAGLECQLAMSRDKTCLTNIRFLTAKNKTKSIHNNSS